MNSLMKVFLKNVQMFSNRIIRCRGVKHLYFMFINSNQRVHYAQYLRKIQMSMTIEYLCNLALLGVFL